MERGARGIALSSVVLRGLIDRLYRHPFEGASARRYATAERPAFGDLDDRLCERWRDDLAGARVLLDVGAGPGSFVATARRRYPALSAIALEPSRDYGSSLRARAEALPLRDRAVDVAVAISSIRHVRDRGGALAELRRVVRPDGVAFVVELDPAASRDRVRRHAVGLGSAPLRVAFGPLVVRTAPTAAQIAALARAAGWREVVIEDDPLQPVYRMRLS